ncbi:hypothetical protein Q7P37_011320 [Cladosporium fusiforme]
MALVNYSDSEDSDHEQQNGNTQDASPAPAKKHKVSDAPPASALPPLPQSFRDLYSSTVRTSTQDDPSLHGGRKRVTPHVAGNWPTHVYLEWCPSPEECDQLAQLIGTQPGSRRRSIDGIRLVRSLLHNDLGVPLPLHVSLSRPLVLRTEQKDHFASALKDAISGCGVKTFKISFEKLRWHPNEDSTRWFLVLRIADQNHELSRLLDTCNGIAADYDQPKLYAEDGFGFAHKQQSPNDRQRKAHSTDKFHISIAWSLSAPPNASPTANRQQKQVPAEDSDLPEAVRDLSVQFSEVKIRIGQDVSSLPLSAKRRRSSAILS